MSDYLDYKNNLAFPPNDIKSQDFMPKKGRESDVLLDTIDKAKYWYDVASKQEEIIYKVKKYINSNKLSYESKVLRIYKLFRDLEI